MQLECLYNRELGRVHDRFVFGTKGCGERENVSCLLLSESEVERFSREDIYSHTLAGRTWGDDLSDDFTKWLIRIYTFIEYSSPAGLVDLYLIAHSVATMS